MTQDTPERLSLDAVASLLLLCGIASRWAAAEFTTQSDRCPVDWTLLNNRCYISKNEFLTFDEAENSCNLLGGSLVSIHSNLENAVVKELIEFLPQGGDTWIGLFTDAEGVTMWTDASNTEFTVNFEGFLEEGCVAIEENDIEYVWAVRDCNTAIPYICARDIFQCASICVEDKVHD
ncbi:C-type lectin galactose-binding isoform-like [Syngnathoides biaculeatus]|uniref:C-type lectin galactose-binding isoform-like n=1 Tax=Syngnathoides biaculeatus TaxID=300417 RepID=UPI002ADD5F7C|nr:C-type lectin galactose-binding isoform-like [Syngnathoides biaculeatus]